MNNFDFDQQQRSVPSGNKTVNAELPQEQLLERLAVINDENVTIFWPSPDFKTAAHAMSMEPCVVDVSDAQASISNDGLLQVFTCFNNYPILNSVIKTNADDLSKKYSQQHIDLFLEFNDGHFIREDWVKPAEQVLDPTSKIGSDVPVPEEEQRKFNHLLALKRAKNCNDYIAKKNQWFGTMKTESMMKKQDGVPPSQPPAIWMGGVVDLFHNNPNDTGIIQVGDPLYYRMPEIIPDPNNSGWVIGEQTYRDNVRFEGAPIEKVMMIIEKYDSKDFCHQRFFANFVIQLMRHPNMGNRPGYNYQRYLEDLESNDLRNLIFAFENDHNTFKENHVGLAYSNAFYGQIIRAILKSQSIY